MLTRKLTALAKASGKKVYAISGVSGEGVSEVLRALGDQVAKGRAPKKTVEDAWSP